VTDRLSKQGRIPFLAIVRGLDLCARLADHDPVRAESFRTLAFTLEDAELRAIANWESLFQVLGGPEHEVLEAEFVFDEPPPFSLVALLRELHEAEQLGGRPPELISARTGSYVEIVCITLGTLMALNLALGMLVETASYAVTLRRKGQELTAPTSKSASRRRALKPALAASPRLGRQIALMLALISAGAIPNLQGNADALSDRLRQVNLPPVSAPSATQGEAAGAPPVPAAPVATDSRGSRSPIPDQKLPGSPE
jgi:hypothetical protein